MKLLRALAIAAMVLAPLSTARAQDQLTLVGVNGSNMYGVYNGAYYGSLNGGDRFTMFCIDYTHDVSIGQTWDVTQVALVGGNFTATNAYLGGSFTQTDFEKAAWLTTQFSAASSPVDIAAIHGAIWDLFLPANQQLTWPGISTWLGNATTAAQNGFGGMDFSSYVLLTPTGTNGGQVQLTTTPEPLSMVLVASGLVGVFLMNGYVRRSA